MRDGPTPFVDDVEGAVHDEVELEEIIGLGEALDEQGVVLHPGHTPHAHLPNLAPVIPAIGQARGLPRRAV